MNSIETIEQEWHLMDCKLKKKFLKTLADKALFTADIDDHILLAYYYHLDKIKYYKSKWYYLSDNNKWYITNTDKIRINITGHLKLLNERKELYGKLIEATNNIELKRYYTTFYYSPLECSYDNNKGMFFTPYICKIMTGIKKKFCNLKTEKLLYNYKIKEEFTINNKIGNFNVRLPHQE